MDRKSESAKSYLAQAALALIGAAAIIGVFVWACDPPVCGHKFKGAGQIRVK